MFQGNFCFSCSLFFHLNTKVYCENKTARLNLTGFCLNLPFSAEKAYLSKKPCFIYSLHKKGVYQI